MIQPSTRPMSPRSGRPDARIIVVARAYGLRPARHWGIVQAERLHAVTAQVIDGNGGRGDVLALAGGDPAEMAAEFWRWLHSLGRGVLLVLGCPDRDLAMLGMPNMDYKRPPFVDPHRKTHYYELRAGRIQGGGWNRRLDIIGLSNWHPEGIYCSELNFEQAARFVAEWVRVIRSCDLGPKLEWTKARQALLSFRRMIGDGQRLRWHTDPEVHEWESRVRTTQSPIRIEPPQNARYERLWRLDYEAHYLSIMATEPMPQELLCVDDEATPESLAYNLDRNVLVLAEIIDGDGERHMVTTVQLKAGLEPAEVIRAAYYRPADVLVEWAKKMHGLRLVMLRSDRATNASVRSAIKALGVSLWAKLASHNRVMVKLPAHPDDVGTGRSYEFTTPDGATGRVDADGTRWLADPHAWAPERFPAVAAHVMAHGAARCRALAGDQKPIYAHTDSAWLLRPPVGRFRRGINGVAVRTVKDVEWIDGVRYVGGQVDAAPGVPQKGTRAYMAHDWAGEVGGCPAVSLPHTALFQIRR